MESNEKIIYEPDKDNKDEIVLYGDEVKNLIQSFISVLGEDTILSWLLDSLSVLISDLSKKLSPLETDMIGIEKFTTDISVMEVYLEIVKEAYKVPEKELEHNKNLLYTELYKNVLTVTKLDVKPMDKKKETKEETTV